jgi:hypothetical protein
MNTEIKHQPERVVGKASVAPRKKNAQPAVKTKAKKR